MAFWNAPLDVPDHADAACRAACAMLAMIPKLDTALAAEAESKGEPHRALQIGIGINSGSAFVGNMGSEQRFDYSIVGDNVNVAARLEAATKESGVPILVSEATAKAAKNFLFVPLGAIALKGKSQATPVFALHGLAQKDNSAFEGFLALHEAALTAAQRKDPDARKKLEALRQQADEATPYTRFYEHLIAGL
jgi:adenylate cyclase